MNQTESALETQVQDAIKEIHTKYELLDQLADQMLDKQAKQQPFTEELLIVSQIRSDVQALENQSAEIRARYRKLFSHSSDTVNQLTNSTSELLKSVIKKVDQLESVTHQAFDKLVPQVDVNVRANQMKQAYGTTNR